MTEIRYDLGKASLLYCDVVSGCGTLRHEGLQKGQERLYPNNCNLRPRNECCRHSFTTFDRWSGSFFVLARLLYNQKGHDVCHEV